MSSEWMFPERRHAGREHLVPDEVDRFDEKLPFDPASEIDLLLELGLSAADTVIDFGTGTGVFPVAVAEHCDRVIAVDVSEPMLRAVRDKIESRGIQNIKPVNAGFLSYEHRGPAASFAYSKDALHHLPDFWKVEALATIGRSLEPGGILRLRDFVFSFDPHESRDEIDAWIAEKRTSTSFTDEEIFVHFREEHSTYGFLLEPMLERVGFELLEATHRGSFYASYLCRWTGTTGSRIERRSTARSDGS